MIKKAPDKAVTRNLNKLIFEFKKMSEREGYLRYISSADELRLIMKWDGTSSEYKEKCLRAIVKEYLSESENGILLATLNLIDEYKSDEVLTDSAEKRRSKYVEDNPSVKFGGTSSSALRSIYFGAIEKLAESIISAEKEGTLERVLRGIGGTAPIVQVQPSVDIVKISDPSWSWKFARIWSSTGQSTENGFLFSVDNSTLEIRNEFYEIAAAKTILTLDPNSKYEFGVEIRMLWLERCPKDIINHPAYTGGAFPVYDTYDSEKDKIVKMGPHAVTTEGWVQRIWNVHTNDAQNYELELRNGGICAVSKGVALFRNLTYMKLASI